MLLRENIIAGKNSNNCLDGCRFPATDNLITFQNLNSCRLDGAEMICKKDYIPWNKGKQNHYILGDKNPAKRPEVRKKISEAKKGQVAGMKGKHHTDETRQKISEKIKIIMANNPERKKRLSEYSKGKHTSTEFKIGQRALEKHPQWKGGISFKPYCFKFNKALKEKIRKRDNYTCQQCGKRENGRKHDIHHIHYDKTNCNPDLITVCRSCNNKANFNRDYWESFFMNRLKERGLLI